MGNKAKTFLIMTFVVTAVGFIWYFSSVEKGKLGQIKTQPNLSTTESLAQVQMSPIEPEKGFLDVISFGTPKRLYTSKNFSFKYPDEFKVWSNQIGTTQELLTIENSKGNGFQIFILSFDEKGPITPERIYQDLPDAKINNPKNADLDGSQALVYNGYDEDMGDTFEVWTVNKGKLYQIMGPKTAEKLMTQTLETWSWK